MMSKTLSIEGQNYVVPGELSTPEMAELYNKMAAKVPGISPVKRFSDKAAAERRVLNLYNDYQEQGGDKAKAKEAAAPAPKADAAPKKAKEKKAPGERRVRQKYFKFPVEKTIRAVRPNTLRALMVDLLKKGATFSQCVDLTRKFDTDRDVKKTTLENVERRAYECIRLIHYYVGYGLDQDADGKIILVEPAGK